MPFDISMLKMNGTYTMREMMQLSHLATLVTEVANSKESDKTKIQSRLGKQGQTNGIM